MPMSSHKKSIFLLFLIVSELALGLPQGPYEPKVLQFDEKTLSAEKIEAFKATPLTQSQAEDWFAYLSEQPDIPFRYPEDGCFARAHRMAWILEEHGVISLKLFIFARSTANPLIVKTSNTAKGWVSWTYHVVPVLLVNKGEKRDFMVVDPSLHDSIVEINTWRDRVASGNGSQYTWNYAPRFAYAKDRPYSNNNYYEADIQDALLTNRKFLALQKPKGGGRPLGTSYSFPIHDRVSSVTASPNGLTVAFEKHAGVYTLASSNPDFSRLSQMVESSQRNHSKIQLFANAETLELQN